MNISGEKRYIPGLDSLDHELPNGSVNSLVTKSGENFDNGFNFDEKEGDYRDDLIERKPRETFGSRIVELLNGEPTQEKQQELLELVGEEREKLLNLDNHKDINLQGKKFQDEIFSEIIRNNPEIEHILKSVVGYSKNESLIDQLAEKREDGTYKIPDEILGRIFELYQATINKMQQEFRQEIEKAELQYWRDLSEKVQEGKLPRQLLDNLTMKLENGGHIFDDAWLFDMEQVEKPEDRPPEDFVGEAMYVLPENEYYRSVLYKKAFISQEQLDGLGSQKIMEYYNFTLLIAGREAAFRLFEHEKFTKLYRESMAEVIGQMIADSSPESNERDLMYYLRNRIGGQQTEREILARLIEIDRRIHQENQDSRDIDPPLEQLCLEAYAEMDNSATVKQLRKRFQYIFDNWKDVIKDSDFPEMNLDLLRMDNDKFENIIFDRIYMYIVAALLYEETGFNIWNINIK